MAEVNAANPAAADAETEQIIAGIKAEEAKGEGKQPEGAPELDGFQQQMQALGIEDYTTETVDNDDNVVVEGGMTPKMPEKSAKQDDPDAELREEDDDAPIRDRKPREEPAEEAQQAEAKPAKQTRQPKSKTARYDAAIAEASQAKRRNSELEAEREALIQQLAEARAAVPSDKPVSGKPKPDLSDYDSHQEWAKDFEKWHDAERQALRQQDARQSSQEAARVGEEARANARWIENHRVLSAEDDADKIMEVIGGLKATYYKPQRDVLPGENGGSQPDPVPHLSYLFRTHERGHEVFAHLGRNPELAAKLAAMPGELTDNAADPRDNIHGMVWGRLGSSRDSLVPMLDYLGTEQGASWFAGLRNMATLQDVFDSVSNVQGRLAAAAEFRANGSGSGPGRGVEVSKASDPGTPARVVTDTPSSNAAPKRAGSSDREVAEQDESYGLKALNDVEEDAAFDDMYRRHLSGPGRQMVSF